MWANLIAALASLGSSILEAWQAWRLHKAGKDAAKAEYLEANHVALQEQIKAESKARADISDTSLSDRVRKQGF
jgi:hypothetical protein